MPPLAATENRRMSDLSETECIEQIRRSSVFLTFIFSKAYPKGMSHWIPIHIIIENVVYGFRVGEEIERNELLRSKTSTRVLRHRLWPDTS
jgi:hypothetical protein